MAILNFKKFGEGEPLIIMHGLYGSSDNWVSIARELMQYFSVYIIDLRNHGASPHLPEHNYNVMVNDLVEFMNDNEINRAIIMGHSMGGKVAMFFAAMHPERVKKLVVVDISPRSYEFDKGDRQIADHREILGALALLDLQYVKNRDEVNELLAKAIPSARVRQFLLKNIRRHKDKSFHWKINIDVLNQNLQSILIGLEDEKDALGMFTNRALFIKGGNSNYIKNDDEVMIKEYFKNAQIATIQGASHWLHAEKPDELVSVVKSFILS